PELHQTVADALEAEGVTVLRNQSVRVERGGASLLVAGVDDLWSGEANPLAALGGECPDTPRVVLAHHPQTARHLTRARADVIRGGHPQGGRGAGPGLGRLLLGKKARRWAAGLYPLDGGHLYVNTGVGFGWRFRFGCRPELAILTLNSA